MMAPHCLALMAPVPLSVLVYGEPGHQALLPILLLLPLITRVVTAGPDALAGALAILTSAVLAFRARSFSPAISAVNGSGPAV